jgi:hypothetical protein
LLLSRIKITWHPSKILKCRASNLQDKTGHSSNMEKIASPESLIRGLRDLGLSENSVLPSRMRACHL